MRVALSDLGLVFEQNLEHLLHTLVLLVIEDIRHEEAEDRHQLLQTVLQRRTS